MSEIPREISIKIESEYGYGIIECLVEEQSKLNRIKKELKGHKLEGNTWIEMSLQSNPGEIGESTGIDIKLTLKFMDGELDICTDEIWVFTIQKDSIEYLIKYLQIVKEFNDIIDRTEAPECPPTP